MYFFVWENQILTDRDPTLLTHAINIFTEMRPKKPLLSDVEGYKIAGGGNHTFVVNIVWKLEREGMSFVSLIHYSFVKLAGVHERQICR